MKKQPEAALHPLCAAVKRVRTALVESQREFANRIGVSLMTISKFETGRAVPRAENVLEMLAAVAYRANLKDESDQFRTAQRRRIPRAFIHHGHADGLSAQSVQEWRLMAYGRTVARHYPEQIAAVLAVVPAARELVDAVLRTDFNTEGVMYLDYSELDHQLHLAAEREALMKIRQEKEKS